MSKPKVVRTNSTPLLIPGKRRSELSRKSSLGTPTKSILIKRDTSQASSPAGSEQSTPWGTPEVSSSFPKRKISQVRFSEGNVESPDYYLYNKSGKPGHGIVNPMSVYRKISVEKAIHIKSPRNNSDDDNDSVTGLEGSDDEENDDDDYDSEELETSANDNTSTRSNSPPMRISSSMSTEAQYAILKAYEDEMYSKIAETFPEVSERLESNRCRTPDMRHHHHDINDIDDLDDDASMISQSENAHKVAQRIQRAMDILDSVRESNGELVTSNKCCANRTIAKNPVRSFERWCNSLKAALEDVK